MLLYTVHPLQGNLFGLTYLERCPSWPKEHDWKSCIPQKGIQGSNPCLSATNPTPPNRAAFFVASLRELFRIPVGSSREGVRHLLYCALASGGVAEWSNAAVSKTVIPLRVSGVQIPTPPPDYSLRRLDSRRNCLTLLLAVARHMRPCTLRVVARRPLGRAAGTSGAPQQPSLPNLLCYSVAVKKYR